MRLFGKHLIDRGLITEIQLVEALDNQRRLTPNIGLVAREAGKLTVHQVLEVLNRQERSGGRFLEAAVELGFLRPGDVDTLLRRQRAQRPRLGKLLVQMSYLTDQALMHELDLYLADATERKDGRRPKKRRIVTAA